MKSEIRNPRQDDASATEDTEKNKEGIRASADTLAPAQAGVYADFRRFKKKGESKKEKVDRRKARGCQLSLPFPSSLLFFPSFFKFGQCHITLAGWRNPPLPYRVDNDEFYPLGYFLGAELKCFINRFCKPDLVPSAEGKVLSEYRFGLG